MTIIVTENPRTGTSDSPSLSTVTQQPGRVLSDLPLGSEDDRLGLDRLVPVLSYTWFCDTLYWQAREWAAALLRLSRTYNLTAYGPAGQTVEWLVAALLDLQRKDVDLFHRDRAEQATRVIPGQQTPLRRDQIPQQRRQRGREYVLQMNGLRWSPVRRWRPPPSWSLCPCMPCPMRGSWRPTSSDSVEPPTIRSSTLGTATGTSRSPSGTDPGANPLTAPAGPARGVVPERPVLLILLLIPFLAFLLVAGLISAVTGLSFDVVVGLLVEIAVVVALWVGGRRLVDGLRRWWAGRVRADTVSPPVSPTRQIVSTARVAQQAMDSAHDLAVHEQRVFRRALEKVGADLDAAQDRHGSAGSGTGEFTGSKDIPFLLAAFARETVKNLGTTLLATQQTAGRRMAEPVDRGVVLPDEELEDPPRRSLPAGGDDDDG